MDYNNMDKTQDEEMKKNISHYEENIRMEKNRRTKKILLISTVVLIIWAILAIILFTISEQNILSKNLYLLPFYVLAIVSGLYLKKRNSY